MSLVYINKEQPKEFTEINLAMSFCFRFGVKIFPEKKGAGWVVRRHTKKDPDFVFDGSESSKTINKAVVDRYIETANELLNWLQKEKKKYKES